MCIIHIHVLCCFTMLSIILNCIRYNHIFICVLYYSLLNSSLPYVLCTYYMWSVVYTYIYMCYICKCETRPQRGLLCAESCSRMRGFQGNMSHFPPPSLSPPQTALHILLLQNCSRAMQKKGCSLQL